MVAKDLEVDDEIFSSDKFGTSHVIHLIISSNCGSLLTFYVFPSGKKLTEDDDLIPVEFYEHSDTCVDKLYYTKGSDAVYAYIKDVKHEISIVEQNLRTLQDRLVDASLNWHGFLKSEFNS
jgi:hypothetical protein